jgi:preprotein translocase subunit YajC
LVLKCVRIYTLYKKTIPTIKGLKLNLMKTYQLVFLLLLSLGIGACKSQENANTSIPPPPPPPGSAQNPPGNMPPPPPLFMPGSVMVKEFIKNEENANRMFKGKEVVLIGEVDQIAPDKSVIIKPEDNPFAVQFYFDDDKRDESLAKLKPGTKVILKGTLEGKDKHLIVKHSKIERAD